MDQFQAAILGRSTLKTNISDAKISFSQEALVLEQSENAHIQKYEIKFDAKGIDLVQIDAINILSEENVYSFILDFEKRNQKIILKFTDGIAHDLELPIRYIEKDKNAWDEKVRQKQWNELEAVADISFSTGPSLVNIYFKPCNENYCRTTIEMYTANNQLTKIEKLMGSFEVDEKMYFKSITGLAFGRFGFRILQYSKDDILLLKSSYYYFSINTH
jgi:hypothetical protein